MNKICKKLVEDADAVLTPKSSFTDVAENIYEQGYIDGKAMERRLMRCDSAWACQLTRRICCDD